MRDRMARSAIAGRDRRARHASFPRLPATGGRGTRPSRVREVIECVRWHVPGMSAGGTVDLSLATRTEGDRTVVEVGGEIDVYTAPKLREQLVDLVNAGKYHLVVDMEGVEFLDSTGLGVLVGGLKRVRAHDGSLRLVCTQERILKIFRITGLTKVFPIHETVEAAVAATE
jgi:anti-sigma B factor antagonist